MTQMFQAPVDFSCPGHAVSEVAVRKKLLIFNGPRPELHEKMIDNAKMKAVVCHDGAVWVSGEGLFAAARVHARDCCPSRRDSHAQRDSRVQRSFHSVFSGTARPRVQRHRALHRHGLRPRRRHGESGRTACTAPSMPLGPVPFLVGGRGSSPGKCHRHSFSSRDGTGVVTYSFF